MRILFLTTQLPYPPVSGGVIKSWRLVEHWSKSPDVDLKLVYFLKGKDAENVEAFRAAAGPMEVFGKALDRPRSAGTLLASYFKAATLNVYRNADREVAEKVREWSEESDILFVDHYEMGQYVPKRTRAKVILHEHNAEYVMWDRLADIESNPIKKWAVRMEARRIRKAELAYTRRADLVWAAPNDIKELVKIGVDESKCQETYHLGEDFMLDRPDLNFESTEKALLFIGTLTWEANIDGLLWFFDHVWPRLKAVHEDLKFHIVGKNPDPRLIEKTRGEDGITFAGFIEDLEPWYVRSRVFVIPLRFGSGIKVKLLNAFYRGIPVVTTPIGTEGLDVTHGEELFSSHDPETQVKSILTLLEDQTVWNSMRMKSRDKGRQYTWKNLLARHDDSLNKLFNKRQ